MRSFCFYCLLVAITAAASSSYDVLMMVQQWPPTTCHGQEDTCGWSELDWFTIHGAWPTRNDSSWPSFCSKSKLVENDVQSIRHYLDMYWPDLYHGSFSFWQHEWEKHGTCSQDILPTPIEYFKSVMNKMYKKHNLAQYLQAQSILPHNTQSTTLKKVFDTWKRYIGVDPIIWCKYIDHKQYLYQVGLCYSKSMQVVECSKPIFGKGDCSDTKPLYWPTF